MKRHMFVKPSRLPTGKFGASDAQRPKKNDYL